MYKYIKGLGSIWVGELPPSTPSNNVIWMRIQRVDGKKGYHELLTWNVFENKWQHLSISELESNAATVDWVNRVIEEHNSNDQSHEDIRDTLRQCVEDIASVNPDEISAKIEAEKQARIASDNQLSTDINAEETRATNEETLIRQEFKEADQTILSTVNKSISDSLNSHNTSSSSHQDIRTLLSECVGLPEYNSSTYEITFTTKAGQKLIIDLPIEQLALKYNSETQSIEFQNGDGTTTSIPVSEFLTEYIGSNGTEIIVTIGENNSIKASLVNDSITLEKLAPEIRESLTSLVTESFVNEESIPAKANASIGQSILTSIGNPSVSNNSDTVTIKVNKKTRASSTGEFGEEVSENLVIPSATVTNAGVMSATDKAKLDNIPENVSTLQLGETSTTAYAGDKGKLNKDILDSLNTTNISDIDNSVGTNGVQIFDDSIGLNFIKKTRSDTSKTFGTGTNVKLSIPAATQEKAGVMSAADKTALDTMEFSSINLIDGSESITVSAPESNNYYSKNIPILGNVSAGDNFAISIGAITDVSGAADSYTINIYDKSGSNRLSNTLSLSKDNRSGVFEILSTVDSQEAILRLFAGYSSETSNHTVRYDKVMLVHGNHPSKVWAPSVNDQKAYVDEQEYSCINLVDRSEEIIVNAGNNNNAYIKLPINELVNAGDELAISIDEIKSSSESTSNFSIAIYNSDGTIEFARSNNFTTTNKTYIFKINSLANKSAASLLLYAGLPGYTGNIVTYKKVMLVRGNHPCMTWAPSVNDIKNNIINSTEGVKTIIDASTLDQDTYYPVTMVADITKRSKIAINVDLSDNQTGKPKWANHSSGNFSCHTVWTTIGSRYGVNAIERSIYAYQSIWSDGISIGSVGQLSNSSTEYIYVRGGGIYYFYTINTDTPILRTSNYTNEDQTVKLKTSIEPLVPLQNQITNLENSKLSLTGGTLSGKLTGRKGVSAFDEDETKTEFNATGKIGGNTQYSTPLLIKTKQANANWNFQFESTLKLLIGPQNGIPIKLYSTTSKSALYATELYQDNKVVATQEWVLQQLANYISKTGDSTVTGTITATSFKES